MDKTTTDFEQKIKDKFKLFKGVRSEEEDQKIFDKVMDLCFEEMLAFLGENLTEGEQEVIFEEMDKKESEEDKISVLLEFAKKIDDYQNRLDSLIEDYTDELLLANINPNTN